ncbi:D-xylose transport system substrate-binding protein [Anaerosporobacter mobilis DSM 15930]|uniref:D-xylose transport system substrate-binding protein n=1 Tax=Anaerosporobacter mobilis DSM 15930 TaxID=1120996 RepID=A0A1M7IKL7_9FIRM|nr:substrate-binding domain-containing protein [Anaerosporobacter mobilis]SHM41260.1 D-xylose transport system substrate-binding protein [Anaerosporobacter mobilis DSM 15930]
MKRYVVVLCVLCLLCMSGCSKVDGEEETLAEEKVAKIQIGMSFDSFVIERWQRDRDVFVSTAKELGAEVNVQNANGDAKEQIAQIEYFIRKKMDVIVIICIDSNELRSVVKKAKNAGINVIAYDRMINDSDVDLFISFDNEMVGTMMAKSIVEAGLEKKKVIMICGPTTDNNVFYVDTGFRNVMDKEEVEILDVINCESWKAELGGDYVYANINLIEQSDGIMCGNDSIATQVVRALAEKRLAGKVYVVGQDADLEACQRIVEGTQVMTVYKPVEKLAQTAAEYAIKLAKKEPIDGLKTMKDGDEEVPYVFLEPIAVTKDNMDEVIIDSGYHLKEDVYLNVPNEE